MISKVSDLTVDELRLLIQETVIASMEDFLEDAAARRSHEYVASVEEARADYAAGNVLSMEQVFGP